MNILFLLRNSKFSVSRFLAFQNGVRQNEALALMTELSDDDTFHGADIYLNPPSNEVKDEDSRKEDCIDMNNLTGDQLRANVFVTLRRKHQDK
ncbi:hypothetical protein NPIL_595001 [Nephila pilipes]|uniref:Uncharacterized protein n=1 Tax=Nephila pilipes TaxID=299642 RepID=A0A8X6TSG4_NEPPI|nr:hypothetical protein NPIL_595001 [Nephila pilipes]